MNNRMHFDFLAGIVLILLALGILAESFRMAYEIGGPFYASPGMMTTVLGIFLLIASSLLLKRSIIQNGLSGNMAQIRQWANTCRHSKALKEMAVGIAILAAYTFILAPTFPFWLSTFLFMVFLMGFLNATSILYNLLVSAATVGSILLVFRVIFHVPLP